MFFQTIGPNISHFVVKDRQALDDNIRFGKIWIWKGNSFCKSKKPANLGASLRASLAARVSYYSYVKVLTYICTWKKKRKLNSKIMQLIMKCPKRLTLFAKPFMNKHELF